jgi:hypothetical protein
MDIFKSMIYAFMHFTAKTQRTDKTSIRCLNK